MAKTEKLKQLDMLIALAMAEAKPLANLSEREMSCPSAEDIACYFDQKLNADEKQRFLLQLSQYPESYALWLNMAETLGYTGAEPLAPQTIEISSLLLQLKRWLTSYRTSFAALLMACFAIFIVLNIETPDFSQLSLEKQITISWQENQVLSLAHMDVSEYLAKKSTKSTREVLPFAEKIAFSHGFKQALQRIQNKQQDVKNADLEQTQQALNGLTNLIKVLPEQNMACENSRCEKQTRLNQQLGNWSALVLHQCQLSNTKPAYWEQQKTIVETFNLEYQQLDKQYRKSVELSPNALKKRVDNLNPSFKKLPRQIQVACSAVRQLALYAIQTKEME